MCIRDRNTGKGSGNTRARVLNYRTWYNSCLLYTSNPVETGKVLTKIVGSFSKEDFIKVEKLISELKNLTSSELIGLKNNLIKQNTDRLKAAGMQFKIDNNRELCGYNNLLVTSNLKKELKQNSLKLFALNKLLFSAQQIETFPLAQSIFEHPVDLSLIHI